MSGKSRVVEYAGLTFYGGYSVPYLKKTCRNMAGLLAAMMHPSNRGTEYKGGIVRAAANHGLVTGKPRTITDAGLAWLASYRGEIAPLADVVRDRPMPRYAAAQRNVKQEARYIIDGLIRQGLILVHPSMVDKLGPEELQLWMYGKAHEYERLTLAQLAARLSWPVEHARIRAERIAAAGYVLTVSDESEAA